ncbi:hypothetical protein B0H14DRAFT_3754363 [Mycena olivaceomarginata]|nr:hypothetical protein B0H14DRAFT_3754363 [Mycena olivaceomarginata]
MPSTSALLPCSTFADSILLQHRLALPLPSPLPASQYPSVFIYLGFIAAGKEIKQPFGYDENNLQRNMFCQVIIAQDIESLKSVPCLNAYLEEPELICHRSMTLTAATRSAACESSPHPHPSYLEALGPSPRIFISVQLRF